MDRFAGLISNISNIMGVDKQIKNKPVNVFLVYRAYTNLVSGQDLHILNKISCLFHWQLSKGNGKTKSANGFWKVYYPVVVTLQIGRGCLLLLKESQDVGFSLSVLHLPISASF